MNHYAVRRFFTVMLLITPYLLSHAGEGRGVISNLNDTLPSRWVYNEHFDQTIPTDDGWWKKFNDPLLDSLISIGVNNNYNVLMAARRMEMARLTMLKARSAYFPAFNLDAGWTKARNSGAVSSPVMPATDESYFSAGINMSWQIDIFGKITSGVKAKKAAWEASRAEYAGAMVSLCGEIATAYFQLRVLQAQETVANEHLLSQEKVVKITEARFECGLASLLDVSQARTVYHSTKATLPALTSGINTSLNAIAVLLAVTPDYARQLLSKPRPLPSYLQMVATGIPMDLLRRRPDIVSAEKELAAYAAELGIAKKDFLPTLTLDGSIGTSAHNIGDLFSKESFTYSIAPTLSWTIFDGMERKYNVAVAQENMQLGIENYNLTVLNALQEVDNAMVNYVQTVNQISELNMVVEESQSSLDLSLDLYKKGLSSFTNVVDAQLNYLTYTNGVIVAQGNALKDLVNLYEALGGGWEVSF